MTLWFLLGGALGKCTTHSKSDCTNHKTHVMKVMKFTIVLSVDLCSLQIWDQLGTSILFYDDVPLYTC